MLSDVYCLSTEHMSTAPLWWGIMERRKSFTTSHEKSMDMPPCIFAAYVMKSPAAGLDAPVTPQPITILWSCIVITAAFSESSLHSGTQSMFVPFVPHAAAAWPCASSQALIRRISVVWWKTISLHRYDSAGSGAVFNST